MSWSTINPFPFGVSQVVAGSNITLTGTTSQPVVNANAPNTNTQFGTTSVRVTGTPTTLNVNIPAPYANSNYLVLLTAMGSNSPSNLSALIQSPSNFTVYITGTTNTVYPFNWATLHS